MKYGKPVIEYSQLQMTMYEMVLKKYNVREPQMQLQCPDSFDKELYYPILGMSHA